VSQPNIQKPDSWKKPLITITSVIALWFVWKADVFWNYYEFKQLCAAEGGLKVYEKLEKGKGWDLEQASEQVARSYLSRMPNIAFIRVPKANDSPPPLIAPGTLVDVRYLGAPALPTTSYSFEAADAALPVSYRIYSDAIDEQDSRITRFWFEVRAKNTEKPMLRYTQLRFPWRTIPVWHWFGPAGTTGCPLSEVGSEGLKDLNLINETAFKG
jgi:hypothetical protein